MKICRVCSKQKSLEEFGTDRQRKDGKHTDCKECDSEYSHRKNVAKYGLTYEQYLQMFNMQNGRCAVCCRVLVMREHNTENTPMIDHSAATGKVRGILCRHCNWAIGHALDDPDLLRDLAAYIEGSMHLV